MSCNLHVGNFGLVVDWLFIKRGYRPCLLIYKFIMEEISAKKNFEKRLEKKLKRYRHLLEKETGIKPCNYTAKHIAICNAGLVNGLTEETVYENFACLGELENITMIPGKSVCFISYKDKELSALAFDKYNGTLCIAQDAKPIYLLYTETVPKIPNLFENDLPKGLFILNDFVTNVEEKVLLDLHNFADQEINQTLKHRTAKHYGYEFLYGINNVQKDKPMEEKIPEECDFLWERLKDVNPEFSDFQPDQLTVNYYRPGQGISAHIDTHSAFEDPIILLSLGSPIVMDFKNNHQKCSVLLPSRSLAILSGECRYAWTHGITPRRFDVVTKDNTFTVMDRGNRISFTFRRVLKGECHCEYTDKCDSYMAHSTQKKIDNLAAANLEANHVHEVYSRIADHFSDTRCKPWMNVCKFLHSLEFGSLVVDIGCGNGKYLGQMDNICAIGCDYSYQLAEVCRERGYEVFSCNCLYVPVRDNSVDGVISIAVIHHLANYERRKQAIMEMVRILCVGGKGLIYVWAKDQNRNGRRSAYLKNRENCQHLDQIPVENYSVTEEVTLPVHVNKTNFQFQDMLVPWKLRAKYEEEAAVDAAEDDKIFLRYYHVFDDKELKSMIEEIGSIKLMKYYYEEGNWCCSFQKIK